MGLIPTRAGSLRSGAGAMEKWRSSAALHDAGATIATAQFVIALRDRNEACHEPYTQLIGNERSDQKRFMASTHVQIWRCSLSMNHCQERGQPCPREPKSRNWRTRLSALLSLPVHGPNGCAKR